MLREERIEGRAEGKAESVRILLAKLGEISEALREKIMNEKNVKELDKWLFYAAKAESIEQFQKQLEQ